MNAKILNKDFTHPADGWYQIEAKGEHRNASANVVQIIDDEAINTIVNRFNADAQAGKLRHGNEMLIDHEHFSDMPDKESRAYGWLTQLQNRDDGIYGQIRWTKTGKEAVDGGDYRFFSTEYDRADAKILNDGKTQKLRPLRLDGLSLTNMNNNRGQKPITNREKDLDVALSDAAASSQHNQKTKMKNIAVELGLDANTDEAGILTVVRQLKNRGDITAADLTTLRNRADTLETENKGLLEDQCATLMDAYGVKEEKVRNRLKLTLGSLKNREERVAALTDFGFKLADPKADKGNQSRVLNRGEGKGGNQEVETANEQELAQKAEREIQDYKIRNRCTYSEARNVVRNSKPELFGLSKQ